MGASTGMQRAAGRRGAAAPARGCPLNAAPSPPRAAPRGVCGGGGGAAARARRARGCVAAYHAPPRAAPRAERVCVCWGGGAGAREKQQREGKGGAGSRWGPQPPAEHPRAPRCVCVCGGRGAGGAAARRQFGRGRRAHGVCAVALAREWARARAARAAARAGVLRTHHLRRHTPARGAAADRSARFRNPPLNTHKHTLTPHPPGARGGVCRRLSPTPPPTHTHARTHAHTAPPRAPPPRPHPRGRTAR